MRNRQGRSQAGGQHPAGQQPAGSRRADPRQPLAVGLATLAGYQGQISAGVMMAAALMAMAPILILFVILQRRVVEGIAFSGLK